MPKMMQDLEDLCAKAAKRLSAGVPAEVAKGYLADAAADIYRDNTRNGLQYDDDLNTPGNVSQAVRKERSNI